MLQQLPISGSKPHPLVAAVHEDAMTQKRRQFE